MKANCCLTASPVTYTLSNKHEMWVSGHHLKEPQINKVWSHTPIPPGQQASLAGNWGGFCCSFCPMHCKHKPCRSESWGSYCCWQIHRARKSEEAESLWPMGRCLTFYFAKNHTPDSDTSILTSGLSQLRGLGARFANSQVELSFFTCEIYVKLQPWRVGSNECQNNSTYTWNTFLLHLTQY